MWQTKYPVAVPKKLGLGLNFWPCSEGYFLSGCPYTANPPCNGNKVYPVKFSLQGKTISIENG